MRATNPILAATTLLACVLPPAAAAARGAGVEHVVVIVVDGLRPDAIAAARAPFLQALMHDGPATAAARAVEQPETLPGLMTLVTGLPPSVHGVTWNNDRPAEYADETLFTRVHAAGGRTGLYFGKSKLALLAPRGSADASFGPGRDGALRERREAAALAAQFAADFRRDRFALALLHFRETDAAGHGHGWMSTRYLEALALIDRAVGAVLGAIEASGRAGATAVLLTSDHGGEGDSHGIGRGETSWRIPFACRVPGVAAAPIDGPVSLLDVAPTALALLRLPQLPRSQGRAVAACLPPARQGGPVSPRPG